MWWSKLLFVLAFVPSLVHSYAPTDEIQDADPAQSGYLPNHNLHPATVGSSIFGILWKNSYDSKEFFYAKPLTYTPTGKPQLVFLASAMNIIRTVDALTGTLINQRLVQNPFLQSDIGCTDIPNFIGIIGTPIIDPNTDTVYFFSKGYQGNATGGGVALGVYNLFAVDINTLADRPGYPVLIDGHSADNDPTKYFNGGTVLQRPSLTMLNGVVIGGFGGHCDKYNYTGMLVAVSTTGLGVTSIYAMEGGPAANPETNDINNQAGGKAGIWQGGMGFATDNSRIFFATGNGQGHANGDIPSSGRVGLTTLDEVVADFAVSSTGKLSLTDYFEPYEYVSMDAADRDLGSGGVALLDPGTFQGTGVSRMAVSIGKNGKAYILNADYLGGFKQGTGGTDKILQTIIASGAVFGGSGSYPLEGGFIYFTPIGFPTVCYKLGFDGSGNPVFTHFGQTKTSGAGRVGIGIPTVTTYKGQAGTGILWVTDPNNGLQAFNAVPDNTGTLTPLNIPPTGGLNKFQRPAFGDGRVYVSDVNGHVYCLGSPVALPLNCTPTPLNFGDLAIGSTSTLQVTCTALIPITKINGCTTGDATFQCLNSSLPQGALASGAQFTFPVTWDLTQANINNVQNSSFGKVIPGAISTSLNILTTNGVPHYSSVLPLNVQGNTVSGGAFLSVAPAEVDFGGIVVGGSGQASGLSAAVIVSNIGSQTLNFTGIAWTLATGDTVSYNNITTNPDGSQKVGVAFSSLSLPAVPSSLAPGASVTIPLNFKTNAVGSYQSILQFWSDGGNDYLLLAGSAATSPVANISVSTIEGGWDPSVPVMVDFGSVLASSSASRNIRICNSGGSALTVTKSKPPVDPELFAARPLTDLHEGQTIDVNACALGEVDILAAAAVVNQPPELLSDFWTLNTDGINSDGTPFGVHDVLIKATITRRQIGPLLADGTARYKYLGCYQDVGRLLPKAYNGGANNENSYCQTTCLANGYLFAGTEYHVECWCGNTAPPATLFHAESEKRCTFSCPLDTTQACGGNGGYISVFYDSLRYTPSNGTAVSSSSMTSSTTSGTSSTVSTTLSTTASTTLTSSTTSGTLSTTSTSTSTSTTATGGPSVVPSVGSYSSVGCYTEATGMRALTGKTKTDSTMTVEECAAFCVGFTWFGVEYHNECYCGNAVNPGSVPTSSGCVKTCTGNPLEICGGSSVLNMYNNLAASSSSTTVTSSTSSSSSPSSSTTSTSSSTTSVTSSSSSSTTTSTTSTSSSSSTSSSTSPSTTSTTSTSSSSSTDSSTTTSTTSTSSSSSSSTSTSTSSTSPTTSTTSTTSSTSSSSPSTTTSSSSSTSTTTSLTTLTTTSSSSSSSITPTTLVTTTSTTTTATSFSVSTASATPTLGFYAQGCFADPAGGPYTGHNMPLLFRNDSVSVELCIQAALNRLTAVPATTYAFVGLEYGRECYAATAAPSPVPTTVTGSKACTLTCHGNPTEKCGGSNQLNLYARPTA